MSGLGLLLGVDAAPAGGGGGGTGLLTSLTGYWKLDESSGSNATDATGAYDLTQTGTVGAGTGLLNGCRTFSRASSQRLKHTGVAGLSISGSFTVAGWVKFDALDDTDDLASKNNVFFFYQHSNNLTLFVENGGSNATAAVASFTTGTWYFVAGWLDTANNLIGVRINNNSPVTSAYSAGAADDGTSDFYLAGSVFSNWFNGSMDEWGFWNGRALSSGDLDLLYNAGTPLPYASF